MQVQILDLFDKQKKFANFIALKNEAIARTLIVNQQQFIHISGISGCGKTHLLNAWIFENSKSNESIYLDSISTDCNLDKILEKYYYIAVDNIDLLDDAQQVKLFDLFNKIKLGNLENRLLTSAVDPSLISIRNDLRTRILSGLNLHIKALDDDEIITALQEITKINGIGITDNEIRYLVNHLTRNIGQLTSLINKITQMALIENKRITIPFIKQVINN